MRYSASLIIREAQVETSRKYYFSSIVKKPWLSEEMGNPLPPKQVSINAIL